MERLTYFKSLLWLCLVWISINGIVAGYKCPRGCQCNQLIGEPSGWYPRCKWDWLSEDKNFGLLFHANQTRILDIYCQDFNRPGRLVDGAFGHLTNLSGLGLVGCHLPTIGPETFTGVTGMNTLLIAVAAGANPHSGLVIDRAAFKHKGLETLTTISLIFNNMKQMPPDTFCGLAKLQVLNMSRNVLSTEATLGLGNKCDTDTNATNCSECEIPHLAVLDLSFNQLQVWERPLVKISKEIQIVYLARNKIWHLASNIFTNLTQLRVVDLSHNRLTTLHANQFQGLVNLSALSLTFNFIMQFPQGLFRDNMNLVHLDLQSNRLKNQVLHVLGSLTNLNMLGLSQNHISDLDGCIVFKNMTDLEMLYLHANYITDIPDSCFKSQTKLSELYLVNNNLTRLTNETFIGLHSLTILHIANNPYQTIDSGIFSLFVETLKYLNMSHGQLASIPKQLNQLIELQELDLSFNKISVFDSGSFSGMQKMQSLKMSWNNIKYIPRNALKSMPGLQSIILQNNQINLLQYDSFDKMNWLFLVNLNNNQIKDITRIFGLLPRLQYLHLRNNRIEALGTRPLFLPASLRHLDVSNNRIKVIGDKPFVGIPYLATIDMRWNLLHKFQKEDLSVSPNLGRPRLLLLGNPLVCDCTMPWILSINKNNVGNYMAIPDLGSVACANQSHQLMTGLRFEDFFCELPRLCTSDNYTQCPCCHDELFGREPQFCHESCWQDCPEGCRCYKNHIWSFPTILKVMCKNKNMSQIPGDLPESVWQFSFSGNHLNSLQPGLFANCSKAYELNLDNNDVQFIASNAFKGLDRLQKLELHGNKLKSLHQWMFNHIEDTLKHLYLHDNDIQSIDNDTFALLHQLYTLTLHNNNILSLSQPISIGQSVKSLTLRGNPWLCDCKHGPGTQQFLSEYAEIILNIGQVICDPDKQWSEWIFANITSNNTSYQPGEARTSIATILTNSFPENSTNYIISSASVNPQDNKTHYGILQADFDFCQVSNFSTLINKNIHEKAHIIALSVMSTMFLCSVTVALTIYSLRELIKLWLFKHFGLRFYQPQEEEHKLYDAFISYSSKDEMFVVRQLAPGLEAMDPPYKLCLHYRDWPVGASIADTIIQSVNNSRRTILLISEDFVKSEWCQYEFQAAHHQVLKDKKTRLIVILLSDISPKGLDPHLRLYIKTNTYLKWNDPRFWDRLRYVMPDKTVKLEEKEETEGNIAETVGDVSPSIGEEPHVVFGQTPQLEVSYTNVYIPD